MGWLFACFGSSKKRGRLKPTRRNENQSKRFESYQRLESSVANKCTASKLQLTRNEPKESKVRITKKVRFNLDVTIHDYIPIAPADDSSESEGESREQEAEKENIHISIRNNESRKRSHPSSYRYANCYIEDYGNKESDDDNENQEPDEDPYVICLEGGTFEEKNAIRE